MLHAEITEPVVPVTELWLFARLDACGNYFRIADGLSEAQAKKMNQDMLDQQTKVHGQEYFLFKYTPETKRELYDRLPLILTGYTAKLTL